MVNTEGAENCEVKRRVRKKKEDEVLNVSELEITEEAQTLPVLEENIEPVNEKQKATVTLVAKSYIVYDLNGESCYKNGHFNVKIGDKIEV